MKIALEYLKGLGLKKNHLRSLNFLTEE